MLQATQGNGPIPQFTYRTDPPNTLSASSHALSPSAGERGDAASEGAHVGARQGAGQGAAAHLRHGGRGGQEDGVGAADGAADDGDHPLAQALRAEAAEVVSGGQGWVWGELSHLQKRAGVWYTVHSGVRGDSGITGPVSSGVSRNLFVCQDPVQASH